ncbi:hypothetical protein P280DRAFT_389241 [Massarina eburnea CBS 473.64]|uniref:DH domain-containing protein n=1 Tax=Massarina eburnea CBS 473.64 TaxID=1395130 RepID=A0A6A6SDM6_9PLEO|nr:hypothetical protein P280DRAFT_389241 [Massarina eburnea CBS 473.64]
MTIVTPEPAALSATDLELFYTTDELLSNSPVLIFYGPTATSTQATHSRIQAHVFTPAGLQNFARLIISPTAAFYAAVTCLPREEQGDEICRGLAFSLYKYYAELPADVKTVWEGTYSSMGRLPSVPRLFSEQHAAIVAARMVKVDNVADIIVDVRHALGEQGLSWLDLDVVLPPGAIQKPESLSESAQFDDPEEDVIVQRYGEFASVVKLFGETAFLPTSKLRRAPSKPTALKRSQSFSRNQKENLRREMCELLDTEENYVNKVYDLVNNVAVEFRKKAKSKSSSSGSPTEQALQALFPPSLDQILEVNSAFLQHITSVLEGTENAAIDDIEKSTDDVFVAPLRGQKDPPDVTGAAALAKALVEWFPKFGDCYTDYMAAHADFSHLIKGFTKNIDSSFSKRVYETGEQRLMSMLIEPVQRLPRYNLYIDNIVKQLPVRHPALKTLLKARDIISEICSREGPSAQQTKVFERLRKMVKSWPQNFTPEGRFITAIDYIELSAPYHGELSDLSNTTGLFLLFADSLVMVHKTNGCTTTARSIVTDLDNPKFSESFSGSPELLFHQHLDLSDVMLSEHSGGTILQLISPTPATSQPGRPRSRDRRNIGIRMFFLQGTYENKVARCVEEVTKAKVESRYPEAERESYKWEVRSISGDLNLFTAITEEATEQEAEARKEPAKVQVVMDSVAQSVKVGEKGVELSISISISDSGLFTLEWTGLNGYGARDKLTSVEFLPVLTKRLSNFFQTRNNIKNPDLAEAYLFRNHQLLNRDGELSRPSSSNIPSDPLAKLEDTLVTFVLALHARKGNIVGRSIRARVVADELSVNEVYNSLLENPTSLDLAAQSSVDVLFASFEKFLKVAWREKMGPVLAHATLVSLQMKSDSMYPGEFEEFFLNTFETLAPQHQRALRAIIRLLAELLDGMGNDGDRGILTAAFADILVPAGNPNDFISLVDRFIQDIEALFPVEQSGINTPNYGSIDSKSRVAGSVNSNTSLRKRFGFGTLTRGGGKSDDESKVGSLWRSLSKNNAANILTPKRPSSRERPTVLNAFAFENNQNANNNKNYLNGLGTIGEVTSTAGPPRKKRRSSLSDLKTLPDANDAPKWEPQIPQTPASPLGSPTRKENAAILLERAPRPKSTAISTRPLSALSKESKDEVTIKSYHASKKRGESVSGIPLLRPTSGLSERPTSGNTVKLPPSAPRSPTKSGSSGTSPRKLRMQSPQKLRERLQNQQHDIDSASRDLQTELSAIGHELSTRHVPRFTPQSSDPAPPEYDDDDDDDDDDDLRGTPLELRMAALEKMLKTTLDTLSASTNAINKDVASSLQVSEARAKHLDKLYRESNAENEALYARFNDELEKVEKSVRHGKGAEEVDRRLKAAEEESSRLRKENARLKREVAGLKAQIRE